MTTWIPVSGRAEIGGCAWLLRMVQKARRIVETGSGSKRIGEYIFGQNDPVDGMLLRFLGISDEEVLDVVRAIPDDRAAAMQILTMSGKNPDECARFSRRLMRVNGLFLAMMDADEGRCKPSVRTSFLCWFYNRVIMAPAYAYFARKERARSLPR
ncbi:MAG TPA: DUF5069 domain-containing protein [Candidatus Baltobacteraceae bacterium]|nr:DUF5069 domain-containing protein [Candidatus Baltobacteraceae bacterium]